MKNQDKQKLRQLKASELQQKLLELQPQAAKMKLAIRIGKEKNLHTAYALRRQIALIKTILHEMSAASKPNK